MNAPMKPDAGTTPTPTPTPTPVLEIEDVTFGGPDETQIWLQRFNCRVFPGQLVVLQVMGSQTCRQFGSLLQGLTRPRTGRVLFQGKPWNRVSYADQFQMRSQI